MKNSTESKVHFLSHTTNFYFENRDSFSKTEFTMGLTIEQNLEKREKRLKFRKRDEPKSRNKG